MNRASRTFLSDLDVQRELFGRPFLIYCVLIVVSNGLHIRDHVLRASLSH